MDYQSRFTRRAHLCALLALGLSPVLFGGCSGGSEGGLVPLQGRVTLDGGPWPAPGQITFIPVGKAGDGAQAGLRPISAPFDTDGRFSVSSYEGTSGLYPGDYWISLECREGDAEMPIPGQKAAPNKNHVPPKYQSAETSGLTLKVEANKPAEANFDVKSK
jgi:hypothetical protein